MYKHLICCIDALKSPVYYITNLTLTKIEFDTKKEEEEDMLKETPLVIKNHKKNTIGAKIYKKNHKKYKIRLNPRK